MAWDLEFKASGFRVYTGPDGSNAVMGVQGLELSTTMYEVIRGSSAITLCKIFT